ncbi:hypothetical protein UFOVP449_236 [uncultured Caudovirales phage]|uniref:Uncharacterized protein n=1 Tax=uncultured Caudovirales phage TaxID=2100421 RepID=A0A6J5MAC5_9CAUD|nr:hypothetical protein UFOVP449_236 [uncultured Caudovirales phage]
MEIKSFKRVSETKVILDGIVWGINPEKAVEIRNDQTGCKLHSIKLNGHYYYPYSIHTKKQ